MRSRTSTRRNRDRVRSTRCQAGCQACSYAARALDADDSDDECAPRARACEDGTLRRARTHGDTTTTERVARRLHRLRRVYTHRRCRHREHRTHDDDGVAGVGDAAQEEEKHKVRRVQGWEVYHVSHVSGQAWVGMATGRGRERASGVFVSDM